MESSQKTNQDASPSSSTETSSSSKNSQKRARQFDFDMLLAQTIKTRNDERDASNFSRISLCNEEIEKEFEEKETPLKKEEGKIGSSSSSIGGDYSVLHLY